MQDIKISFRVSKEENDEINRNVERSGLSKSEYLRNIALKREVIVIDKSKQFVYGLCRLEDALRHCEIADNEEIRGGMDRLWLCCGK